MIFGGNGDQGQLFTVNAATGAETLLGFTGRNFVGDLDFRPIPEPGTLGLAVAAIFSFFLRRPHAFTGGIQ